MMKKRLWNGYQKKTAFFLVFLCLFALLGLCGPYQAQAKKAVALNQTTLSMAPATTKKLSLDGAVAKKVKWTSGNKKVAVVSSSGTVTAKAKGTAKIRAAYGGVKYVCTVTVTYKVYTASDGMRYKDAAGNFGRTGRWFKKSIDGGSYYFTSTDGSAIYFKTANTKSVNVSFVSNVAVATPYFAYSVDGGSMKRQLISNGSISFKNAKTHYVRLLIDATSEYEDRWGAEAGVGIKFVSATSKDGIVTAIKPQNANVAFYGDSITKGVRALKMALTPGGTSAVHSFPWYCASQLDLVPYFIGFSGSGITETGSFNTCYNAIQKLSAYRAAAKFDADVVVIEHGCNDVYTHGTMYVNEYKKVLELLHKKFPKAVLISLIPFNQIHAEEIRQAASAYKWCNLVETASWGLSYTDGMHPNAAGAKKAGLKLAKIIASKRKVTLKGG